MTFLMNISLPRKANRKWQKQKVTFLYNPKDLDPSYETDLGFWIVLEWKKQTKKKKQLRFISGEIR